MSDDFNITVETHTHNGKLLYDYNVNHPKAIFTLTCEGPATEGPTLFGLYFWKYQEEGIFKTVIEKITQRKVKYAYDSSGQGRGEVRVVYEE